MKRITKKMLEELTAQVNEKRGTDMMVFANMYGYGIANRCGFMTNYFNGTASECRAFLLGLLCEPITEQ